MRWYVPVVMVIGLFVSEAHAREDLDVTMRMVLDERALTESVVREIELPEPASVERPDQARESRGAPGMDMARDAREQGREFGQEMAEKARESSREKPGRPELPEQVQEVRDNLPEAAKPHK
ncbi:hypothetical protein [Marinobacter sp. DUT-1]|uniref:hypothetical protein n=1 Tax=Marinobacter sp. DUT-1 TaxID=3412037 RepID=UPI003D1794BC